MSTRVPSAWKTTYAKRDPGVAGSRSVTQVPTIGWDVIYTGHWLLYFGLLFVGFIVFSPTGLVGVAERLLRPFRKVVFEEAAMAGRQVSDEPLPPFLRPASQYGGPVLEVAGIAKHFGGIRAVQGIDFEVADRTLHALIGPNGAGKTTAFNLVSGMFPPDTGTIRLLGRDIAWLAPERITRAGIGRSFQITNLFPTLTIEENLRLASRRAIPSVSTAGGRRGRSPRSKARRQRCCAILAWRAWRRRRPARFPMAASGCSTWGWRSARNRGCCCSTSRWRDWPPPSASASAPSSSGCRPSCPCCWLSTTSTACSASPTTSPS